MADPLVELDEAIEKAKPLLARQKNGTRAAIINGKRVTLSRPQKAWGGQRVLTIHTPKQDKSIPNQVLAASRGDRQEKRRALAALIKRPHPSTIAPGGGPVNSKRRVKKANEQSPLEALDSAIEKARGLIPRGGSSRLANRLARQGAKLRDKGGDPKAVKRFAALGTLANRKKGNSIGLGYEPGKGYKSLLRRGKYK